MAGGTTVDLAIQDERRMARICCYFMTHIADSLYYAEAITPTPKQKQSA